MATTARLESFRKDITPLAGAASWDEFSMTLKNVLRLHGSYEIVMEPAVVASTSTSTTADAETVERDKLNSEAFIIIFFAVTGASLRSELNRDADGDGRKAWSLLRSKFEASSLATRIVRRSDFWNAKHAADESVETFIGRASDAADALARIGLAVKPEELRDLILANVSPRFSAIRSSLSTQEPEPTLERVIAALTADEATRISTGELTRTDADAVSDAAFRMRERWPAPKGQRDGGKGEKDAWCALHGPGHWSKDCYRLVGINAREVLLGAVRKAAGGKGGKAMYAVDGNSTVDPYLREKCPWTFAEVCCRASSAFARDDLNVDSGASRTYSPLRNAFACYVAFQTPRPIELADGTLIYALGSGTLAIDSRVDGCPRAVSLPGSWYVPRMVVTLISIKHLHALNMGAFFPPNGLARIADAADQTLAHVSATPAGWLVVGRLRSAKESIETSLAAVDRMTAHLRLGHLKHRGVVQTSKLVDGFKLAPPADADELYCSACAIGQQKRAPFRSSDHRDAEPGRTICFDLSGAPGDRPARGGYRYSLICVDNHSNADWVYLLKRKSEAEEHIEQLIRDLERQYNINVAIVRTDGGGEFRSARFNRFLRERGIRLQVTFRGSSQSNGMAERMIGVAQGQTAAMLAAADCVQTGLPHDMWGEAMLAASHTRRFWKHPRRAGITRHEALTGERPDASHLRAFGAEATVHCRNPERYGHRAIKGVLVGYTNDDGRKGYRVAVPREVRGRVTAWDVIHSRDVEIREAGLVRAVNASRYDPPAAPAPNAALPPATAPLPAAEALADDEPVAAEPEPEPELELEPAPPIIPRELRAAHPDATPAPRDVAAVEILATRTRGGGAFCAATVSEDDNDEEMLASCTSKPAPTDAGPASAPKTVSGSAGQASGALPAPNPPSSATADLSSRSKRLDRLVEPNGIAIAYLAMGGGEHQHREPRNHAEAMRSPDADHWLAAEAAEMVGHAENGTWSELAPGEAVPRDAEVIGSQWVYALVTDAEGRITRYKARLVARGDRQHEGKSFDLERLWAPTARYETMRAFLSVCAKKCLRTRQLDVSQAYLKGVLKERIYMRLPDGRVVRLRKTLYGLRQAAREWNAVADATLRQIGFTPLGADRCLYIGKIDGHLMLILLYVDDMKVGATGGFDRLEAELRKRFKLKSLGDSPLFLGCRVAQDIEAGTIALDQRPYLDEFLARYGFHDVNPNALPMAPGLQLTSLADGAAPVPDSVFPYASVVGGLLWLALISRPDIAAAVVKCARFVAGPGPEHVKAAKGVMRYLAGTRDMTIVYRRDAEDSGILHGFTDADWGQDPDRRHSTTGYVFFNAGAPVSWSSHRQKSVARSSLDAEYYAMDAGVCELIWLIRLLSRIDTVPPSPVLRVDNEGAIALAKKETNHSRTKHIDVKHHFVRECWESGQVAIARVGTDDNVADIFTKALNGPAFLRHRARLLALRPK
jgi:transposase InsO family protein